MGVKEMSILQNLPQIITAIGGLGTAAFGLVDATKPFGGGVNRIGFKRIEKTVRTLTPGTPLAGMTQDKIIDTLRANWYNGKDLASQKSIAKSLIKAGLHHGNAAELAAETGVDEGTLQTVAKSIGKGTPLKSHESDVYSRFDFIVTGLLDEVYQHADQTYTNWTRFVALLFAMLLALVGGWIVHVNLNAPGCYWRSNDMAIAFLAGLLATPLAPIAKDISSALSTAVNTLQLIKK
jgi:hypothetical protein